MKGSETMVVQELNYKGCRLTCLVGSTLAELVLDDQLLIAIPDLDGKLATMQQTYLEAPLKGRRQVGGLWVCTVLQIAIQEMDCDLAHLMMLAVHNLKSTLSMEVCEGCVLDCCNRNINETFTVINKGKWTEANFRQLQVANPISTIARYISIRENFRATWLQNCVHCTRQASARYDIRQGAPEGCPFELEHILIRDKVLTGKTIWDQVTNAGDTVAPPSAPIQ